VPPESVGGRPLLLTCKRCNSSSGHGLDWHWANFWAVEGFAVGDLPEPVTVNFVYEDLKTVAELSTEDGTFVLKLVKKASNPELLRETERLFGEAVAKAGQPEPMKVNFHKSQFDQRLLRLSVLRAGYLVGIAVGGYHWIHSWDPIRLQILAPETRDSSLSGLVRYEREHPRTRRTLAIIEEPREMRCFYVGFGRWTVFLPWERTSVLYRPHALADQRIAFRGTAYKWPTAPTFGIDWTSR
jgi:hypothetical protein